MAAEEVGPVSRTALGEYAQASRTPLHILAFLLPIIVVYEVGLALQHEALAETGGVRAWAMLARVMETLGVSPSAVVGYSLPAAVIVIVLLLWHVFEKQRWRVRPTVVLVMAAETVAWMVPLLLFAGVLTRVIGGGSGTTSPQPMSPTTLESLEGLGWQARLVIALGAGLYEELLFRMQQREQRQHKKLLDSWNSRRAGQAKEVESRLGSVRLKAQQCEEQALDEQNRLDDMGFFKRLLKGKESHRQLDTLAETRAALDVKERELLSQLEQLQGVE
ncbi:MAG: hypothetical protein AAFV77_10590, partial [Planctomycetota bacterium]